MSIVKISDKQREEFGNLMFDRALYVFTASITKKVVESYMNEVHDTGRRVREPMKWSVIAPSEEWARFYFEENFANVDPSDVTVECIPINAEVSRRFK